jgi:hypothetical protein
MIHTVKDAYGEITEVEVFAKTKRIRLTVVEDNKLCDAMFTVAQARELAQRLLDAAAEVEES